MSNRKKYESHARAQDAGRNPHSGGTSALLQRLLQKVAGTDEQERTENRGPRAPAGRRSGSGTQSVAPYLDEARNSRPGPLE